MMEFYKDTLEQKEGIESLIGKSRSFKFRTFIPKPKLVETKEEKKVESENLDFSRQESTMKVDKVTEEIGNPIQDEKQTTFTKPCVIRLKYKTRFNPSKEVNCNLKF
jgi:hypothetical protein